MSSQIWNKFMLLQDGKQHQTQEFSSFRPSQGHWKRSSEAIWQIQGRLKATRHFLKGASRGNAKTIGIIGLCNIQQLVANVISSHVCGGAYALLILWWWVYSFFNQSRWWGLDRCS